MTDDEPAPDSVLGFDHTRSRNLWALASEQWRRGHDPDDTTVLDEDEE